MKTRRMYWKTFSRDFQPHMEDGALKQYEWNDPAIKTAAEQNRVWTVIDGDPSWTIADGYHTVNALFYVITEKPAKEDTFYEIPY